MNFQNSKVGGYFNKRNGRKNEQLYEDQIQDSGMQTHDLSNLQEMALASQYSSSFTDSYNSIGSSSHK